MGGGSVDPVTPFNARLDGLSEILGAAAGTIRCEEHPRLLSRVGRVPLEVVAHSGETLLGSTPLNVVDGISDPELGVGWRVRPAGAEPRIDLRLDEPTKLQSVSVVAVPLDGTLLRTRLVGRGANGRFIPLAGTEDDSILLCRGIRVFELSDRVPPLTEIRVELQGDALSYRSVLHEVWADARGGPSGP